MPLTVVNVAYPFAPVGMDAVGGAEQILSILDDALVERGHHSIVIAAEGSSCRGVLVPTPRSPALLDAAARARIEAHHREALRRVLCAGAVDVIHFHGLDCYRALPAPAERALVTLHLPPALYAPELFAREDVQLVCVSEDQARRLPKTACPRRVIPNGVPLGAPFQAPPREDFALMLGRICPEKGFGAALDAAALARIPLLIAGRVFPYEAHLRYFEQEIQPRLGPFARLLGPVGPRERRALLASARCLLIPSLIDETSSLSAMEALAAGTPVIAFPRGALPEIIEDGQTGFLVEDTQAMADAIGRVASIQPEVCRRAAEARFSAEEMVERYLDLYAQTARRGEGRTPIKLDEVHGLSGLSALREAWSSLCERCPWATPFQRPEWLLACGERLRDGDPWAIVLRRRGTLVGLLPLTLHETAEGRKAGLLGAGISDVLDVILDPAIEPCGADAILEHLAACPDRLDAVEFEGLRAASPLLAAKAPRGFEEVVVTTEVCPTIGPGPLPARLRREIRTAAKRAAERGEVRFELAGPDTLEELLEALVRLHGQRWSLRGTAGVLADPAVQAFHRAAAPALLARGVLRMHALRIDGQIVAVNLGFQEKRRRYLYLGGFDIAFQEVSPGILISHHAIEEAFREGAEEVDFLRGGEGYKYRFGAVDRPNLRRQLRAARG